MDSINVKVIDLWAVANLMKKDHMKYVSVSISESDDGSPATLDFKAIEDTDSYEIIDYDPIDETPDIDIR